MFTVHYVILSAPLRSWHTHIAQFHSRSTIYLFLCIRMEFTDLNLTKPLSNALADLSLTKPTAIQSKVFSTIMSGKDVVGIAQTGTGKTFAYLLPVLRMWKFSESLHAQVLIVVPTRELVAQVVEAAESLSTYINIRIKGVYGGTNIKTQKAVIHDGVDIVVGTPGRLADLMTDGVLKTKFLKQVIIDEVDEMLNLGFRTQLRWIINYLPERRQHLMFSATLTEEVELVIQEFTDYYEKIETAPSGAPLEHIAQSGYRIENFNSKINLLRALLDDEAFKKVLVFAKTKKFADAIYEVLQPDMQDSIGIIHSSKSQNNRFETVSRFQEGSCRCLIATDIIARGLDVSMVSHVINFELTDTPEKYIHRIGRTGRSEAKGVAISFISESDLTYLEEVQQLMNQEIEIKALPTDVELSDELIALEKPIEHVPYNVHKIKITEPSGPAFHEKLEKNKKVNRKIRRAEAMKLKYGKPIKKRQKKKRK